jgi:hypothetical protein
MEYPKTLLSNVLINSINLLIFSPPSQDTNDNERKRPCDRRVSSDPNGQKLDTSLKDNFPSSESTDKQIVISNGKERSLYVPGCIELRDPLMTDT